MIVKDVKLTRSGNKSILSARCHIRKIGWDTVYFKIDSGKEGYIKADASPFAVALLLPSMKQGEDLIIHGSISTQLLSGMQAVMEEVLTWDIGLHPIAIKAGIVAPDTEKPTKTGSYFSGGVDSFYTFLKHTHDKEKRDRVDSFIFINNSFDIDQRNKKLWDQTLRNIKAIAKAENIELIVVESNINSHELLAPILSWDYIHGACLAATGLVLRKAFRRMYIPSTHSVSEQIAWGSNLALDKNWSTETISFQHDGSEVTRLDKVILEVSKSPTALKHLRVCYKNVGGSYNCGNAPVRRGGRGAVGAGRRAGADRRRLHDRRGRRGRRADVLGEGVSVGAGAPIERSVVWTAPDRRGLRAARLHRRRRRAHRRADRLGGGAVLGEGVEIGADNVIAAAPGSSRPNVPDGR